MSTPIDFRRWACSPRHSRGDPSPCRPPRPGEPSWTDGQSIFVDPSAGGRANLESVAVHASLISADSLANDVVDSLVRHPRLARRYLAVEGHRALAANSALLPTILTSLFDPEVAGISNSPEDSLSIASTKTVFGDPPAAFGVIRAKKVMTANTRAAVQAEGRNIGARASAPGQGTARGTRRR